MLYMATQNPYYLQVGETMLRDIDSQARTKCGFASLKAVGSNRVQRDERMESFFFSETLKYLYLLFDHGKDYFYSINSSTQELYHIRIDL